MRLILVRDCVLSLCVYNRVRQMVESGRSCRVIMYRILLVQATLRPFGYVYVLLLTSNVGIYKGYVAEISSLGLIMNLHDVKNPRLLHDVT